MSRGPGRVERFVLAFLAEGREPALPSLGWSAREIASAMTGDAVPSRSAVVSVGRAIRELESAGLAEVWYPQIRRRGANMFVVRRTA